LLVLGEGKEREGKRREGKGRGGMREDHIKFETK